MESVEIPKEMRDPAGHIARYDDVISSTLRREQVITTSVPASLEQDVWYKLQYIGTSKDVVLYKYGVGDTIESIKAEILARSAVMAMNAEFVRINGIDENRNFAAINGIKRLDGAFTAMALLLVREGEYLEVCRTLLSPDVGKRSYLTDLLIKAFIPDYSLLKKYKTDKRSAVWMEPLLRGLASAPDMRSQALTVHMKNWCRVKRPWGWKPGLNAEPGKDPLFCDFAFEVALAVCAYDIDDSAFRDHPYYPRELVKYYRANVRHTRDAWRGDGAGAGRSVAAPAAPKNTDLAKSRRKAIARWVELVCDGNVAATEAVLETIGKPRKLDDIDALMSALSEENQAIHADIKDDETTLIQAGRLAETRGLGEFERTAGPPFGPTRCSAGLLAFASWLQTRGYRLVDLDNQDDAWHAVVVRAEYHDELLELSNGLKIVAREPGAAYND